jgi:hypothetical protein
MPVRITEINRMRNLVVLEFKFDATVLEVLLCAQKIFSACAKSEMQHLDLARTRRRLRITAPPRKQSDCGVSFADKNGNAVPHAFVKPLETENFDIPLGRPLDVANRECYVINSFELHEQRGDCLTCGDCLVSPCDRVSADRLVETFQGNFSNVLKCKSLAQTEFGDHVRDQDLLR